MTATVPEGPTFLTLATERQFVVAQRLTPTPGCAACLAPANPHAYVDDLNVCTKCAKAGEFLRAAVEAPDALRRLADELEDAVSERHEPTAMARFARVIDALTEQIEAVVEVVEGMAERKPTSVPASYPTGGFGLLGRGVWKAPWMGRNGEMVLVAVAADHRVVGAPKTLPLGSDYIAKADELWHKLEEHERTPTVGHRSRCPDCSKDFIRTPEDRHAVRCPECRPVWRSAAR